MLNTIKVAAVAVLVASVSSAAIAKTRTVPHQAPDAASQVAPEGYGAAPFYQGAPEGNWATPFYSDGAYPKYYNRAYGWF